MKINFRSIPLHQRGQINEVDRFSDLTKETFTSYIAALLQDILINRQFYQFDNQYIVDNPLYALSIMYRLPPNSNNLIVSKPDKDEKSNFPYNMTELANFRYVIEKFINPIFNTDVTLKEGRTQWLKRIIYEIQQRCLANNITICLSDDFYEFDGKKELTKQSEKCYNFVNYLSSVTNNSNEETLSSELALEYWNRMRDSFITYDFSSEHFILTKKIIDFTSSKEQKFDTIEDWISDCLQDLNNVGR